MLPIVIPPETDELLYSWQCRLACANGFDSLYEFGRFYIYPHVKSRKAMSTRRVMHDDREDFMRFYQALAMDIPMYKLYRRTTCYSALAPFLSEAQQIQLLNCTFRRAYENEKGLTTTINSFVPELRFCPMCRTENSDGALYYRAHQLPGVCVCHKHHCMLKYFNIKSDKAEENAKEMATNASSEVMAAYAHFAKALLDVEPDCDITDTKEIIMNKLYQSGYYDAAGGYPALKMALENAGFSGLFTKDIEKYLKVTLCAKTYVPIQDTMTILLFLFGNATNFLDAIEVTEELGADFMNRLQEGYTLSSPVSKNFIELEHTECGKHFCTTMAGFVSGWNCPLCDQQKSSAEIFEGLVSTREQGRYKLLSPYTRMYGDIRLQHSCGRKIVMKARKFLYDGTRCICESQLTTDRLQNKIRQYGDFELLDYVGRESRMTVRHKTCGQVFQCTYSKFIRYPWCKVCKPKFQRTQESFATEIKELTGDEYVLSGSYVNGDTKVRIRHTICGIEQEYLASGFIRGRRCSQCHKTLSADKFALAVSALSGGAYSYEGMATQNMATIRNIVTGAIIEMEPAYVMQELQRPTPSKRLPCERKNASLQMLFSNADRMEQWLVMHYTVQNAIFLEDVKVAFPDLSKKTVERTMRNLQYNGRLQFLGFGIYGLLDSRLTVDDIVYQRYIVRQGKAIGYYYGQSFAYQLGLIQQPPQSPYIATNKEAGLHGRDVNVCCETVHLRSPKTPVTDENCKLLQLLDMLPNITKYTDLPSEDTERVMKRYLNSQLSISAKLAEPYLHLYPSWVKTKFYKLLTK